MFRSSDAQRSTMNSSRGTKMRCSLCIEASHARVTPCSVTSCCHWSPKGAGNQPLQTRSMVEMATAAAPAKAARAVATGGTRRIRLAFRDIAPPCNPRSPKRRRPAQGVLQRPPPALQRRPAVGPTAPTHSTRLCPSSTSRDDSETPIVSISASGADTGWRAGSPFRGDVSVSLTLAIDGASISSTTAFAPGAPYRGLTMGQTLQRRGGPVGLGGLAAKGDIPTSHKGGIPTWC